MKKLLKGEYCRRSGFMPIFDPLGSVIKRYPAASAPMALRNKIAGITYFPDLMLPPFSCYNTTFHKSKTLEY
jgi:hypothetical protein